MTTNLFGTPPAIPSSGYPKSRGRRAGSLGIVAGAAIALFLGGVGATASAAPDNGSTIGNVDVGEGITLTGLTASFTLSGFPTDTVTGLDALNYNVVTNSPTGYTVTAIAQGTTLVPAPLTGDTIPIAALTAADGNGSATGSGVYLPVTTVGTLVHSQATRSAALGDDLSTDFQMLIPNVALDVYSVNINYLAAVAGG